MTLAEPPPLNHSFPALAWSRKVRVVLGWGGVARRLRELASEQNVRLKWTLSGVELRDADRFMRLDWAQFWLVFWLLENWEMVKERCGSEDHDPAVLLNLSRPLLYRQRDSNDRIWHPHPPEWIDVMPGYLMAGAPGPGDVVFDGGAYVGEVAVEFAHRVGPGGRVISFEPESSIRNYLQRNVQLLGLNQIEVRAEAMWSGSGHLSFHSELSNCSRLNGIESMPGTQADSPLKMTEVETVSLEQACARVGVVPDFVKLDVEGAELEIIQGSLEFIARHDIKFAIASYHVRNGERTAVALERLFQSIGYRAWTGYPEHLTTWAHRA